MSLAPVLEIDGLAVGSARAEVVADVSFDVAPGEIVALLGESGSGKTTAARALCGLLPSGLDVRGGRLRWEGAWRALRDAAALGRLRGRGIAYVPGDPRLALCPVRTVGGLVGEVLQARGAGSRAGLAAALREGLVEVGLERPEALLGRYPAELSGGQRQRVLLAAALATRPRVLVADEPTSALDAPLRLRVAALLRTLSQSRGLAVLALTHDLRWVEAVADRVGVLCEGRLVEWGPAPQVLRAPLHPATRALLGADPRRWARGQPLPAASTRPPGSAPEGAGCRYAARCPVAGERCRREEPRRLPRRGGAAVACHEADP